MLQRYIAASLVGAFLTQPVVSAAQGLEGCNRDAMLVFDGSGSMAEMGFNGLDFPRIFEAREAIREVMPRIETFRRIGLVIYGPGSGDSCSNVDLRFPPIPNAAKPVIHDVETLDPNGDTPLTEAVSRAVDTLMRSEDSGEIVLITDGRENCDGKPCMLAAELAADTDVIVHVIGFRVRGRAFQWADAQGEGTENGKTVARCLADRTGGTYVNAEGPDELVNALQNVLGCPVFSALVSGKKA